MKELRSGITKKGQATIPAAVRRLLGVGPHDVIAFVIEDGDVRIRAAERVVARTAGAFKSHEPPLSAEELRELAERLIAEDVMKSMDE